MAVCQEIIRLLDGVEFKTSKVTNDLPKIKETLMTFKDLERVAVRYLAVVKRLGLPDGVQQQVQLLSQLIVIIRMAQMSYNMLIAGTPVGLLMGVAGLALTGLSFYDSFSGY